MRGRFSCTQFSREWRGGVITAFDALAAFDGFDALGRRWKLLGVSWLGMGKTGKGKKRRVF